MTIIKIFTIIFLFNINNISHSQTIKDTNLASDSTKFKKGIDSTAYRFLSLIKSFEKKYYIDSTNQFKEDLIQKYLIAAELIINSNDSLSEKLISSQKEYLNTIQKPLNDSVRLNKQDIELYILNLLNKKNELIELSKQSFFEKNAMYVVLLIALIIWIGLFIYMTRIEIRIKKLEKEKN